MQLKENIVNSIINKAQEIGLTCQINELNKWTICLKKYYTVEELETGWMLLVQGNPDMYIDDTELLEILREWLKEKFFLDLP